MSLHCTRCEGSGFLNLHQIAQDGDSWEGLAIAKNAQDGAPFIFKWMSQNKDSDVQVCDCCGDSEGWYGIPGEHYNFGDPRGHNGPYAYNGGMSECH